MTKEKMAAIGNIAKRADEMGLLMFDRMSLMMDLEVAADEFNLRLDDLLGADNFNFAHDINGIQQNINRQTKKMENFFLPRYASRE
jgi:hypothetical protein